MTGMGKRIIASTLAAIGIVALGTAVTSWGACWAAASSAACLAASDMNAGMLAATIFWVGALLICGLGLFNTSARVGSAISIALLMLVNPLTDPGFIWAFDSADSTPGRGILGAAAILGAALLIATVRHAHITTPARPRAAEAI